MLLIYLSCAWVAGIFLGAKFAPPAAIILTGLVPLPLLFWFHRQPRPIILASLCIIVFFGGALYFQSSLTAVDGSHLSFYNDRGTVEIKGVVATDPEVRDKTTHLPLSVNEVRMDEEWREVSGEALLFVPRYPAYAYGDELLVTGKLETPPQLDDFDYTDYLAHQGIYSTMLYPRVEVLGTGKGFKPLELVYSLRNRLSQALAEALPEPQASLAQGMVLGKRGTIPSSLEDDMTRSGTAHLLAISGLHLGILAGMLLSLGIWLFGRRHGTYIWLTLGVIWLYVLITGMHPPVIRGAIMASLFLTAELLGRQRSAFTALAFAAAIMVGISPQILWQAAFQMSFMAMAGLIFIFPPLRALGRKAVNAMLGEDRMVVPPANFITDSFGVTLGAILAVWPLVAHYFGIVSFTAPLATFLVLPVLPGVIITGVLAGGIGLIALPVAQVIAWLAWLFLSYFVLVVNVFAAFPLAFLEVGSINTGVIAGYYLALGLALWFYSHHRRASTLTAESRSRLRWGVTKTADLVLRLPVKWVIPPLLVLAILVSVTAATMPDDKLHVSFFDVGEGDAILVRRGSQEVLIDGGPSPQAIGLGLGKQMPFWDRTIEMVILTHPHADHLTGLVEVLQRYQVGQVLYAESDYQSPLYDEWLSLIKNTRCTIAQVGQEIDLGRGAIVQVLNPQYPPLSGTESDVDNNGVVLRLSLGKISFLFTADIFWEAEFDLTRCRAGLSSTVLKVAHHGSDTSTTEEFLDAVDPRLAVVSTGGDSSSAHPAPEVVGRLEGKLRAEDVYRTDEHGTIEFITDGERLWMKMGR